MALSSRRLRVISYVVSWNPNSVEKNVLLAFWIIILWNDHWRIGARLGVVGMTRRRINQARGGQFEFERGTLFFCWDLEFWNFGILGVDQVALFFAGIWNFGVECFSELRMYILYQFFRSIRVFKSIFQVFGGILGYFSIATCIYFSTQIAFGVIHSFSLHSPPLYIPLSIHSCLQYEYSLN